MVKSRVFELKNMVRVSNAISLPITCTNTFSITCIDYANSIRSNNWNWLNLNPTKRPQYWVLFVDIPSRIGPCVGSGSCGTNADNSVSYELNTTMPMRPFVTHINMKLSGDTSD